MIPRRTLNSLLHPRRELAPHRTWVLMRANGRYNWMTTETCLSAVWMERIEQILRYWFGDRPDDPDLVQRQVKLWFAANAETDQYVREHFEADLKEASAGALTDWEQTPAVVSR